MKFIVTLGRLLTGAMVTGLWHAGSQYTREQANSQAAHLIREVERGVKYSGETVKLALIKKED